jgi:chromosome segregation ATPase
MNNISVPMLLCLGLPLAAQTAERDQTLHTLLAEVQQLRLAIERSTLLGTRTQVALLRIQMQEARAVRVSEDLDRVRGQLTELQNENGRNAERAKDLEGELSRATDPKYRKELEDVLKHHKQIVEMRTTTERQLRAREAELAGVAATEQSRLTDLHQRIEEMERALDAAIQQLLGRR